MEKSTAGKKKISPDSRSLPNQKTIIINIKWYYFPRYGKKYYEIQLIKKQNGLNYSINDKSCTLPRNNPKPAISMSQAVPYFCVSMKVLTQS